VDGLFVFVAVKGLAMGKLAFWVQLRKLYGNIAREPSFPEVLEDPRICFPT
jgi:hypothetical protein